jgi:hypothetical protein
MNLGELRAYTRESVLRDVAGTRQWSDPDLVRWLNDAQDIFARKTCCLLDDTSDFMQVTTVATQRDYTLDPRIVTVFAVSDADNRRLRKLAATIPLIASDGKPSAWSQRGVNSLTLWPTPDDAYTLTLLAARLPLAPMEIETDAPEIPGQWHLALCDWAGYRALRNTDSQIMADVRDMTITVRKDWERALVEGRREAYFNQRGA